MKKIILIAAMVAITVTSNALAVFAAAPTEEQCKNATDPGNISPQVSTESNGQTLEVKVSGAYGLNSKQPKMYRYKTTGQQRTKWLEAKSYTWQLPESAAGTDINVRVWVCAYKKNTWVKGNYTHTQELPSPQPAQATATPRPPSPTATPRPTATPTPPTATPTPTPRPTATPTPTPRPTHTPTPVLEPQRGIESDLFNYVGWSGRIGTRKASVGCSAWDSDTKSCPDDMPAPYMEQLRAAADIWDEELNTDNPVELQVMLSQNQTTRTIAIGDEDGNPTKAYIVLPYGCGGTEGFCGGNGLLVHEMGHALGMARNTLAFWDLVVDDAFTGEHATAAHNDEPVPMYNPGDGIEAHWGTGVGDIMSWDGDFSDPTISAITIGAFTDIGYTAR